MLQCDHGVDWRDGMMQATKIMMTVMLLVAVATMGYAETGAMTPEHMKMMDEHMKGKMKGKM